MGVMGADSPPGLVLEILIDGSMDDAAVAIAWAGKRCYPRGAEGPMATEIARPPDTDDPQRRRL